MAFLGHIFSDEGIMVDPKKNEAVKIGLDQKMRWLRIGLDPYLLRTFRVS